MRSTRVGAREENRASCSRRREPRNELIERCGGMAKGHTFRYLPGGASGGILPPRWRTCRSISGSLKSTAASSAATRWSSVRPGQHARRGAEPLHFFKEESCGQCTPCGSVAKRRWRHVEEEVDTLFSANSRRDGGCIDLRPGPGGPEPDPVGDQALCEGYLVMADKITSPSTARRSRLNRANRSGRSPSALAPPFRTCAGRMRPATAPTATAAPAWGSRGRARSRRRASASRPTA